MKPKQNQKAESGAGYDCCYTPWHGVAPLFPYLAPGTRVWEPACGNGMMANALIEHGCGVHQTDWTTGHDFFTYAPEPDTYDVIVTNPPYSLKREWMRRCYELGKPWALLVPFETLSTGGALAMYRQYGWEELRLMQRVNFHMPDTGFHNNGAQFPVVWLCWHLLPAPIIVADVPPPRPEHRLIRPRKVNPDQMAITFV